MSLHNLQIPTEVSITDDDLQNILKFEINKIIPISNTVLSNKFTYIVEYNRCLANKAPITYLEYYEEVLGTELEVSKITATDISRIKKNIENYNINNTENKSFTLSSKLKLSKNRKLNLFNLKDYYIKNNSISFKKEVETISSIKIYDYYQNSKDKNKFFKDKNIKNLMKELLSKVKKIEVLSIIDTEDMYNFLSNMSLLLEDKITIKHMTNTEHSYIPSVFFILIKYKIKGTKNYRDYIFYLEEEVNWGVANYVTSATFSKQFLDLLELRFNTQFKNNKNLNFNVKDEENIFEDTIENIFDDVSNILDNSSNNKKELDDLIKKISKLKIQFPKMNYSYKLLSRLIKYSVIIKKIVKENKKKPLPYTNQIVKKIIDLKINLKLTNLLSDIRLEQNYKDKKIDILKLRKGVLVNTISNTNLAICDIFDTLEWTTIQSILTSLKTIEEDENMLNLLFSKFNKITIKKTFKKMNKIYIEKVMSNVLNGENIKLSNSNFT